MPPRPNPQLFRSGSQYIERAGAMPKSLHEKARADLQDIWMTGIRKEANAAFDLFVETCGVKYEKAVAKLVNNRDELPAF